VLTQFLSTFAHDNKIIIPVTPDSTHLVGKDLAPGPVIDEQRTVRMQFLDLFKVRAMSL
jgi:hypothetical protein